MKAIVTGAAGFVGSHLTRALLARGDSVVGVDCLTDYYDVQLKKHNISDFEGHANFLFLNQDILTVDLSVLGGVDVVFHLAGQPGVRPSWGSSFHEYVKQNISASQALLEGIKAHGADISRIVYASSSSIYGDAESFPTSELATPKPMSPYGVTKLAAEHLMSLYARNFGIPAVSLRYFTVYGPGQRPDMAFTRFISAAIQGRALHLYGTGDQVRDFTYVGDVVRANLAAAEAPLEPGTVLNVAGGGSHSVNECIDLIGQLVGRIPSVEKEPVAAGDVKRTGADTRLASQLLGWTPSVGLAAGLQEHVDWAREAIQSGLLS